MTFLVMSRCKAENTVENSSLKIEKSTTEFIVKKCQGTSNEI